MAHHNSIHVHGVTNVEYGPIQEMSNGGVPFYCRELRITDEAGNTFTVNMFSDKQDGTVMAPTRQIVTKA